MNFLQEGLIKKIVKSPINPVLYLCIISPFLFYLASKEEGYRFIIFICIACFIIILFFVAYFYLLFKKPEYLRSEQYQFQMNQMRFYGDKDNPKNIEINNTYLLIKNPKQNVLSKAKEDESK